MWILGVCSEVLKRAQLGRCAFSPPLALLGCTLACFINACGPTTALSSSSPPLITCFLSPPLPLLPQPGLVVGLGTLRQFLRAMAGALSQVLVCVWGGGGGAQVFTARSGIVAARTAARGARLSLPPLFFSAQVLLGAPPTPPLSGAVPTGDEDGGVSAAQTTRAPLDAAVAVAAVTALKALYIHSASFLYYVIYITLDILRYIYRYI